MSQPRFFTDGSETAGPLSYPGEAYWSGRTGAVAEWAAETVRGRQILDIRSGDGTGRSALLAAASDVVVLDRWVNQDTMSPFPFPDASFDVVIALDVLGHEPAPREFVGECARVLLPSGRLVVSAPNRHMARSGFHRFEVGASELSALILGSFDHIQTAGVFHGSRITRAERIHRDSIPARLIDDPAPSWPGWVARIATSATRSDFTVKTQDLQDALDLIAIARRACRTATVR